MHVCTRARVCACAYVCVCVCVCRDKIRNSPWPLLISKSAVPIWTFNPNSEFLVKNLSACTCLSKSQPLLLPGVINRAGKEWAGMLLLVLNEQGPVRTGRMSRSDPIPGSVPSWGLLCPGSFRNEPTKKSSAFHGNLLESHRNQNTSPPGCGWWVFSAPSSVPTPSPFVLCGCACDRLPL